MLFREGERHYKILILNHFSIKSVRVLNCEFPVVSQEGQAEIRSSEPTQSPSGFSTTITRVKC